MDEVAAEDYDALVKELTALTPGGSEFHGDPKRCVAWIKDRLSGPFASVKDGEPGTQAAVVRGEKGHGAAALAGSAPGII